ncbi:DUF4199 domain-containing protein [Pedobacter caeni]|uniref:DUF4199 domain-containing protein n=1 Tax=Pedobacter caeni TaxID=288992 RepID=A0A1M4ZXR8_9SPHI|nr:DUF4199 domain-containing protein [Pedobacter caeni]SHF22492.1 Protein of unknown function [Pedobacter caeni]
MQQNLLELEKKPNKLALQAALAFAIYFFVLIFIFKFLNINGANPNLSTGSKVVSQLLSYVPFFLAIAYVQTNHKKELGGYISFSRAFSAGFRTAAYAGFFLFLLQIIYYFVDKSAIAELMDVALEQADGDEQKIKGIEMMRPYMGLFIGFGTAITYTIVGLIVSLIGAAIFKKDRPFEAG